MKWFGETWLAPCCDPADHVATPTGEPCLRCERPIASGDQGFLIPLVTMRGGEPVSDLKPHHLDCFMESILPCPGCEHCRPPPAVHVLHRGSPLCGFSRKVPGEWPPGHRWVRVEEAMDASCRACVDQIGELSGDSRMWH